MENKTYKINGNNDNNIDSGFNFITANRKKTKK